VKPNHRISVTINHNQITATFGLAQYILKALLKNKSSFFFGLVFPIVIVAVFGAFNNNGSQSKIGIANGFPAENVLVKSLDDIAAQKDAPITVKHADLSELKDQLSHNKLDGVVANSDATKVTLYTSNTNQQGKGVVQAFVNSIVGQINLKTAQGVARSRGAEVPELLVEGNDISGKSLRAIDFILPGQIGFSLLSVAIFGVAFSFLTLRKTLVLKRIFATNVKPMTFVVAQSLARSVQGVLQALILILFGVVAFHFTLANGAVTLAEIAALSVLSVLAFIGFGIFFANVAPDEQSLPIMLNLFNLPQLFLSGVFFSTDALPHWLQMIGNNLPLGYVNTAMRKIATDGAPLHDILPYLAGMAGWAIISYILAARTFKTE
jgi:ABC-2 type transport system permease protein